MEILSFEDIEVVGGGVSAYEAGEFCGRVVGKTVVMVGVAVGLAAAAIYAISN